MTQATAESRATTEAASRQRVFTGKLFRERRGRASVFTDEPPAPPAPEPLRPLRAARMLALAHRLQAMIDAGEVEDRASLARNLGFTRARITQLLDLLLLAPDIQEALLDMQVPPGRDPFTEHDLRQVVRAPLWAEQRERWRVLHGA